MSTTQRIKDLTETTVEVTGGSIEMYFDPDNNMFAVHLYRANGFLLLSSYNPVGAKLWYKAFTADESTGTVAINNRFGRVDVTRIGKEVVLEMPCLSPGYPDLQLVFNLDQARQVARAIVYLQKLMER